MRAARGPGAVGGARACVRCRRGEGSEGKKGCFKSGNVMIGRRRRKKGKHGKQEQEKVKVKNEKRENVEPNTRQMEGNKKNLLQVGKEAKVGLRPEGCPKVGKGQKWVGGWVGGWRNGERGREREEGGGLGKRRPKNRPSVEVEPCLTVRY